MTFLKWHTTHFQDVMKPRVKFPAASHESHAELDRTEIRRRIWHISPGLLPFLLVSIPHADPLPVRVVIEMSLLTVVLATVVYRRFDKIARNGRGESRLGAVAGYAGPVLFLILAFPAHAELAVTVVAILAFGDGTATVGGLLIPSPRLPWNQQKSWAGSICFVGWGGMIASCIYWLEARPAVPFDVALKIGLLTACVAAACESVRSRLDDNLRVGIAATATLLVLHFVLRPLFLTAG